MDRKVVLIAFFWFTDYFTWLTKAWVTCRVLRRGVKENTMS